MKLAFKAFMITLTILTLVFAMSAQTLRSKDDARNTAPTVGTGGSPGGPTGLFTIYDGQTLRRGEFTFSAAYSNYDRDPGNVDITEVPVSFQVGLSDYVELFFNTDAYRGIKVNSPRNLSSFYLPNSAFGGRPTIVLGTGLFAGRSFLRVGQPFVQFPFIGGPSRSGGSTSVIGVFPSPVGGSGSAAATFPGIGSAFGSILPGVVLQTTTIALGGGLTAINPTSFTAIPSYLPDAPFINRGYGTSAFNTFTVGAKIRFTGPNNPVGFGIIPFYRFYADKADDASGFNQLQRGASPGGNRGDFGGVLFADARLRKWVNLSANVGYIYNSSVKADFPSGTFTILDRPDELLAGIGLDFPVNQYFQPILEFRTTQYVGGRTLNAFENSPLDGLAGARIYPTRWFSISGAYRYHFNQQDADSFDSDAVFSSSTVIVGSSGGTGSSTVTNSFRGVPPGFQTSTDPHGFILQFSAGRRNVRDSGQIENKFADVTNLSVSESKVIIPCAPGERPREGVNCSDKQTVTVATTAVDPENDVLTYNYTVSGGRISGSGANVSWDLSGVNPGTYTITAGVDDGCGVCGKTQTKTITVEKCDCFVPEDCVCPTVSVTGPDAITEPGGVMTFTANLSGGSGSDYTYTWKVSQGDIIDGQGTPVIRVQTSEGMAGQNIVAMVTIGNTCSGANCANTAMETGGIKEGKPNTRERERFGPAVNDDVKARIQNLYIDLNNNPSDRAVIINYGSAKDIAKREKQIRDAIKFLKQDASRVTLVRGGDNGSGIETVVFIVPSGADAPTPER